jgi:predicted GNAT family N-acyltransferase
MAVVDDARGKGVGRALLQFLENEARRRGAKRFTLNAQVSACRFYEKAGYHAVGSDFDDAGIPHVRMDRDV